MRAIKILCLIFSGLIAIYALAGFFVVPAMLEKILPQKLAEALNRPATVNTIRLNPFLLSVSVEGFDMKDKNGVDPFVSFDRLFVKIDPKTLITFNFTLEEIRLERPQISLARVSDKEYNISDLMPSEKQKDSDPQDKKPPLPILFAFSNIQILNGHITFKDIPKNKTHVFSPIHFTLPFISNFEDHIDTFATPSLEGSINDTDVSIKVETKPFKDTFETIVHLGLTGISLPYYAVYAPENLGIKIVDGSLDLQTQISYTRSDKHAVFNFQGDATLSKLAVTDPDDASILTVPKLKVKISPCHPLQRQVKIASVIVEQAELNVIRDAQGKLNLLAIGPPPGAQEDTAPTETTPSSDASKEPFQLEIDQITLGGCKVAFTDQLVEPSFSGKNDPFTQMILDNIVINIKGFSLAPEANISFDLNSRLNAGSLISANGETTISPFSLDGKFDIQDIHLQWLVPYMPENIGLAITDGRVSTSGTAKLTTNPDGRLAASVQADAAIDRFFAKTKDSLEKFVSWDLLAADNIHFSNDPLGMDVDLITLNHFNNFLTIHKDGKLNVQTIFKTPDASLNPEKQKPAANQPAAAGKQKAVPIKIRAIQLKDVNVLFSDQKIEPNFSTRLLLSEAKISGFSTQGDKAAKVFARGSIDDHAPIEIKGDINPLGHDVFLDMALELSNLELSPFSSYTGKFIGRTIEKGKLKMDISDRVENKTINGRIQLLLDQFTLGKNVDSPDALNLPVGLAVALLKDRSGKITLDVPVTGRTDDPEYKPGGLFWKAVQNIITKAATSPFDLVASVVAGGPDLKYIEFEPGRADVDEENAEKIQAITTLMFERPGIMLDLSGFADPVADRRAFAEMALDRKLKEIKYADLSKKQKAATTVDNVTLSDEEFEEYLKELYKTDVLSNPEKAATAKKLNDATLTREEIKSLLLGQITVNDNALRDLALRRAQAVKNELLKDGRVEAARVFIKETGMRGAKDSDKLSPCRVELSLK